MSIESYKSNINDVNLKLKSAEEGKENIEIFIVFLMNLFSYCSSKEIHVGQYRRK